MKILGGGKIINNTGREIKKKKKNFYNMFKKNIPLLNSDKKIKPPPPFFFLHFPYNFPLICVMYVDMKVRGLYLVHFTRFSRISRKIEFGRRV